MYTSFTLIVTKWLVNDFLLYFQYVSENFNIKSNVSCLLAICDKKQHVLYLSEHTDHI